jgi:hypothetical protein
VLALNKCFECDWGHLWGTKLQLVPDTSIRDGAHPHSYSGIDGQAVPTVLLSSAHSLLSPSHLTFKTSAHPSQSSKCRPVLLESYMQAAPLLSPVLALGFWAGAAGVFVVPPTVPLPKRALPVSFQHNASYGCVLLHFLLFQCEPSSQPAPKSCQEQGAVWSELPLLCILPMGAGLCQL